MIKSSTYLECLISGKRHEIYFEIDSINFMEQCCNQVEKIINKNGKERLNSNFVFEINSQPWVITFEKIKNNNGIYERLDDNYNFFEYNKMCEKVCKGDYYFRWNESKFWIEFELQSDLVLFKLLA